VKNEIVDLRNHLFAALEALADPEKPMDIARAKAIADVAQTIINSATVEVKYLQATGQNVGTGFIRALNDKTMPAPANGNVTVHKLK